MSSGGMSAALSSVIARCASALDLKIPVTGSIGDSFQVGNNDSNKHGVDLRYGDREGLFRTERAVIIGDKHNHNLMLPGR